ncbi:MAG: FtsW/RodA/SpoVE family cell cycle protein [Desulfotomaculaceae bacterium]|nr:FtsW/RodA/SpoVE family cell cycle protein [Desulfotomaculaceae bacterium]
MPSSNKYAQEFLQSVCQQIRFKGIHENITNELSDHIDDQKNEYIKQGFDEEAAFLKAVEQMGDPVLVGKQLDKAHRPKIEWSILSLAAILVVAGGFVQYFLSGVNADNSYVFSHFLIYAPAGIAAFTLIYFFDYTLLGRYPKVVYLLLFTFTIVGFLFFNRVNGSYTHVYYSALLFIPAFAGIVYDFRSKGYLGIIASGLFYAGAAYICLLASKFTGLILLTVSCLIILTVAIKKGFFGSNKLVGLAIAYIPVIISLVLTILTAPPYLRNRLAHIVNPELDPLGSGYIPLMVKRLIASSQPFGEAVLDGNIADISIASVSIEQLLPNWATDFSLTYIIARLGYVAGLVIIAVMLILIARMFFSVMKQKNAYGYLVSLSACLAITGQVVLYILSNIGVITPFSVTLPFISFGGMGFVVNMILVGLLLSVYRLTDLAHERPQGVAGDRRLITLVDGKLIIDLGMKAFFNKHAGRGKNN